MRRYIVMGLLSLVFMSTACAATVKDYLSKFYLAGQVGWTASHFSDFSNHGLFGASAGLGYNVGQNFSVETSFISYRDSTAGDGAKITQQSWNFLLVTEAPLIDHFSGYTKIGAARMSARLTGGGSDESGYAWRFAYGAGLKYTLSSHIFATLEWYHVQGKAGSFAGGRGLPKVDFYSLGLGVSL